MITAGIDCGAKNTKAVLLKNHKIVGRAMVLTGFEPGKSVETSLAAAAADAGISTGNIAGIGGTGSGRGSIPSADYRFTDIKAMARAARFFDTNARTIVDVGAEEGRMVKIDETGAPTDFTVNDRCAAGTGAFIEAMARALNVTVEEMGALSQQAHREITLSAQCVIFAESEVIGLIHANTDKSDIGKAIHIAVAARIASMIHRIGISKELILIGGVGRNPAIVTALKEKLKLDHINVPPMPEYGTALGAALLAHDKSSH